MIYLLYGPDEYSKRRAIQGLKTQLNLPVEVFTGDALPDLEVFQSQDLFGGKKAFILHDALKSLFTGRGKDAILAATHDIIFVEGSLDKRLTTTKEVLKDSRIKSQEFALLEGKQLLSWALERAKELEMRITDPVLKFLLERLGVPMVPSNSFTSPIYSLEQINSELEKVATYAGGEVVTTEDVQLLVPEIIESQALDIVNALASKNKLKVIEACNSYFLATSGDDKSKLIQLNSLLAEQLRSIAIVQGYNAEKLPDEAILAATGWKSGRLFMVRKTAQHFSESQIIDTLQKLENLDIELKTTSTPPRVLLDLILAPLL